LGNAGVDLKVIDNYSSIRVDGVVEKKKKGGKSTVACDLTNSVFGKCVAELHDAYFECELEVLESGV
jgi:hypothetical protein